MRARLWDIRVNLKQPWLIAVLLIAMIPLFPEYIAPFFAVGSLVAAVFDAKVGKRPLKVGIIGKLLIVYIVYMMVGVLYSAHKVNSLCTVLMWLVAFCVYLSLTNVLTNHHRFDSALFSIALVAGIIGLVALFQYVFNNLLGLGWPNQLWMWIDDIVYSYSPISIDIHVADARMASTFTNPNMMAEYLVMIVPFVAYYSFDGARTSSRILCRGCLLFGIFGILFSFSRGSYLALLIMLLILWFANIKKILILLLGLVSTVLLVPDSVLMRLMSIGSMDYSISQRFAVWDVAMHTISESPLFGYGPGVQNIWTIMNSAGINAPHCHNLFLQLLVEGGLVGLLLIAAMGVLLLRVGARLMIEKKETRLLGSVFIAFAAGFVMIGLIEFPFLSPKLVIHFMSIAAITDAASKVYLRQPLAPFSQLTPKALRKSFRKFREKIANDTEKA